MSTVDEIIQSNIVKVESNPETAQELTEHGLLRPAAEENIIEQQKIHEFFGIDFADRTGREATVMQRKIRRIMDHVQTMGLPTVDALIRLENVFGNNPYGVDKLDHFYRKIKISQGAYGS